jgi:hypothetical protein
MSNEGCILISRSLLDSETFTNEKMLKIWIWLIAKANWKDKFASVRVGRGQMSVMVKRGQLIFGRFVAEEKLNIDGSTIYKILKKFEAKEDIVIESNSHYSLITICNYDYWQTFNNYKSGEVTAEEQPSNSQVTAEEQPSNSQVTAEEQPSNTPKQDNTLDTLNSLNKDLGNADLKNESAVPIIEEKRETLKDVPKKEKKDSGQKKENDFIDQILEQFQSAYLQITGNEYEILVRGKERNAAAILLGKFKSKYPDANTEDTLIGLREYFVKACNVPDQWMKDNISPSLIVSKFNEINTKLKNATGYIDMEAHNEWLNRK